MGPVLRWNPGKARSNLRKHGVTFEEAASVFRDALSVTISDPLHSTEESRFVIVGRTVRGTTLVVVHSDSGETIRIISATLATRRERMRYEEGTL
ncbi:MAG: BrnT family toxin [Acidobacteria bacterium]|nr:BrnT family toxin [Acidobacteriota bacterium]